jgi:hypothetical protein
LKHVGSAASNASEGIVLLSCKLVKVPPTELGAD